MRQTATECQDCCEALGLLRLMGICLGGAEAKRGIHRLMCAVIKVRFIFSFTGCFPCLPPPLLILTSGCLQGATSGVRRGIKTPIFKPEGWKFGWKWKRSK